MGNSVVDVAIEVLKERSKDIYDDGLKPATKESGEALQAIVGLFNNVVLYPVKKANITFVYKLDKFKQDMEKKTDKIPSDKLVDPPLAIAGNIMESLKYTFDVKKIREMYINLLASAMNLDTVKLTHTAYVEIIKSMMPLDAIIFQKIVNYEHNLACGRVTIGFDTKVYTNAMPEMFIPDLLCEEDPFLISSSITNLCRLGLITRRIDEMADYNYDSYKENPYVLQQLEIYKKLDTQLNLEINVGSEVIYINNFGKNFATVCLDKK